MSGKNFSGGYLKPVEDTTMDMPIRYGSDKRIRSTVNPDQNKAIQADGNAINSIADRYVGDDTWEIGPEGGNGRMSHDGIFDYNETDYGRAAITIEEKMLDTVEEAFVDELERHILG